MCFYFSVKHIVPLCCIHWIGLDQMFFSLGFLCTIFFLCSIFARMFFFLVIPILVVDPVVLRCTLSYFPSFGSSSLLCFILLRSCQQCCRSWMDTPKWHSDQSAEPCAATQLVTFRHVRVATGEDNFQSTHVGNSISADVERSGTPLNGEEPEGSWGIRSWYRLLQGRKLYRGCNRIKYDNSTGYLLDALKMDTKTHILLFQVLDLLWTVVAAVKKWIF